MRSQDIFYSVTAVVFLSTIAYFSVLTETIVEIEKEMHEVFVDRTDTLYVTNTDTVYKYKDYRNEILINDREILFNKQYLFHIADDTVLNNTIRNALPFGAVFNYWRDELGPCGVFDWNEQPYVTLYKEESLELCYVKH